MIAKKGETAETADREIVSKRLFHFPRELVFKAWTDPEHLVYWWGPKGFTNTFQEFNPRPGGIWRFVMHGPDGKNYQNESIFVEIVKPERIVFHHLKPIHEFQVTATFEDLGGKTKLTWCMRFNSAAECEKVKPYVVEANQQNLDRLEAELAKMARPPAFESQQKEKK